MFINTFEKKQMLFPFLILLRNVVVLMTKRDLFPFIIILLLFFIVITLLFRQLKNI